MSIKSLLKYLIAVILWVLLYNQFIVAQIWYFLVSVIVSIIFLSYLICARVRDSLCKLDAERFKGYSLQAERDFNNFKSVIIYWTPAFIMLHTKQIELFMSWLMMLVSFGLFIWKFSKHEKSG